MSLSFRIGYKSNLIPITLPLNDTVLGLKQHLTSHTDIPPENQKLLWGGKILQNDQQLADLQLSQDSKITLMGSQPRQLKEAAEIDKKLNERLTLAPRLHKKTIKRTPKTSEDHKYTFHRITTLPEFPNPDQAHKLLERLRDDRGVRAIMKARQWSVGELIELTPFEATLLGYNRNSGQLIAIRLRTDDLSGFRHYDSIRKVLLHELTHNVWSAHDDNFHELNRQLNKDVVALDWTAHGGRSLDNEAYYDPEEREEGTSWESGTYRLGGSRSTPDLSQRELIARAASGRLTKKEEQEMDNGCGSHQG